MRSRIGKRFFPVLCGFMGRKFALGADNIQQDIRKGYPEEKLQILSGLENKNLQKTKKPLTNRSQWCKMEVHTVGVCVFLEVILQHRYSNTDHGDCQEKI